MPYIKIEDREKFYPMLEKCPTILTKGELEYLIFWFMKKYMVNKTVNYSNLHDTTYAPIHCGDEFRRRYLDMREEKAREENGDI